MANYCGTYSQFPSQMFDRRVEILNTLYLGLRAYELSTKAKLQVTDAKGSRRFESETDAEAARVYFYQYLPFSSRAAAVIQEVSDKHAEMVAEAGRKGVDPPSRAQAASLVKAVKQQTTTQLPSATFDAATYDPIRSEDLWAMCGAWRVGRVMDTKAAVHDRYAGGPRDTAFSCIVDVGIAWGTVLPINRTAEPRSQPTGFLLPPSEGGYVPTYEKDGDGNDDRSRPIPNSKQEQRSGQQDQTCLANNQAPPLTSTIGRDVGRNVLGAPPPRAPAPADNPRMPTGKRQAGRDREAARVENAKRVAEETKQQAEAREAGIRKAAAAVRAAPVPQAAPVAATPAAVRAALVPQAAPVAATPAATGAKPPGKPRGKSPARPRPTPTGAAAVPAAAAGVSATPLVPTASGTSAIAAPLTAAVDAAPRRRARETGESVTNSLFANMFSAPPMAESAAEAPASPTPSSGSEGPSSGPRTFRRQR